MRTKVKKQKKTSNWADLPSELLVSIFLRLNVFEILVNVQKVCKPWYCVSKDPSIWKNIDIGIDDYDLDGMCRHAIDRSEGGLVGIKLGGFCSDSLLTYISDRSSNLRSLGLAMIRVTSEELSNAVSKLPLLEELKVSHILKKLDLKAIGLSCPKLKTLELIFSKPLWLGIWNRVAFEIAESMPELRHLKLFGDALDNTGLNAILDGCPHLEHLDIRECFNIKLEGDLERRCERIKVFRGVDYREGDDVELTDSDNDEDGLAYELVNDE